MSKAPAQIKSKARQFTDNAFKVLAEIMNDRSAPYQARVIAATEIINRGLGKLDHPQRFGPLEKEYYVYSIHDRDGRLIYVGKGCDRRHLTSAQRLGGKSRIRAEFDSEAHALKFERRLIQTFKPRFNLVYNRTGAEISAKTA
jgi:hypothetical protein